MERSYKVMPTSQLKNLYKPYVVDPDKIDEAVKTLVIHTFSPINVAVIIPSALEDPCPLGSQTLKTNISHLHIPFDATKTANSISLVYIWRAVGLTRVSGCL